MNDTERQAKLRMALPEVRTKYKEMASDVDKAGHLILELMRHPDVAPEMVAEAQASYARTYAMFTQMRDSLRKLYPVQPSIFTNAYPWKK
jgi:hypothetical protein